MLASDPSIGVEVIDTSLALATVSLRQLGYLAGESQLGHATKSCNPLLIDRNRSKAGEAARATNF
jgi:hypothetical protein